MINVLIIGMADVCGGIETFIIQNYRNIDKRKINFDFLTYYPKCVFEDEFIANGSNVFHLTRRGANPVKSYFEQQKFFKNHRNDYDYIWIHQSSASNIIANKLARKYTNAKIISHCHGVAFESKGGIVHKIHTILDKFNYKKFIECTDYKFACSKAAANWLFKTEENVFIIKNGIDVEKFTFNLEIRNNVRKELAISEDAFVIGHAGRFCEVKNHNFIIDVFNKYLKYNQNAYLVLAGDGELLDEIKQKAHTLEIIDKIRFLGFRNDLDRLYQAFDVFVLPSLFEGFPVSVVEAQSSELPCIVSDKISKEINITNNVYFLPINGESHDNWVEKFKNTKNNDRNSLVQKSKVIGAGYDIKDTALFLQNFFIKEQRGR